MPDLSILCVTKGERSVLPLLEMLSLSAHMVGAEFVLVADGPEAFLSVRGIDIWQGLSRLFKTETKGYIESVLDSCINLTTGRYVLRIDDDESIPPPLIEWLRVGAYKESDHWKFNRAHLINGTRCLQCQGSGINPRSMTWNCCTVCGGSGELLPGIVTSPPLWPDHQTRLSTRDKSLGRTHIHCGSPHGGGVLAPYPIIHHKFVIKSRQEREEILKRYDEIQPGAGGGFWQFSVPERGEERGEGKIETISYAEFVRRGYTI